MTTPFDAALHLTAGGHQITASTVPGVAPLPPVTGWRWLWHHASRIAPAAVPTAAWLLARWWHLEIPAGSTEPLWVMGALSGLAGLGGTLAAARQHGSSGIVGAAFTAAGVCALTGITAWTPRWSLSLLLLLGVVAGAYALCAPHWRDERRERLAHEHELRLESLRGDTSLRDTAIRAAGAVEVARELHQAEVAKVQAIVAASDVRTRDALLAREQHALAPGQELDVAALLQAAGIQSPGQLEAPPDDRHTLSKQGSPMNPSTK